MWSITTFVITQSIVSGYACWRGGVPERLIALSLLLAMLATANVPHSHATSYHSIYWAVVAVDFALFVGLTTIALFADRYWPMGVAALQLLAVMAHGAVRYDHAILAIVYWLVVGKTSYLMLAVLGIGTARHHERQQLGFPEYAWSARRRADKISGGARDAAR